MTVTDEPNCGSVTHYPESESVTVSLGLLVFVAMSHWFHRNPLKATGHQDFQVKMVAHDMDAIKICR